MEVTCFVTETLKNRAQWYQYVSQMSDNRRRKNSYGLQKRGRISLSGKHIKKDRIHNDRKRLKRGSLGRHCHGNRTNNKILALVVRIRRKINQDIRE